jgi:hypothetical protein
MAISRINKNVNAVQDYEDVIAVVDGYIQGLKHGSVDQLRESFHADGIMYGHGPDGLLGGSIDNLYTFVEHYGKAPDIAVRLDVLDMTPTTAVVKVTMEKDAAGADYTDYHSLIKIDGQWKVVAKLFHLYDQ